MAIVSRNSLYSFFETGDIPTQEEFADLIDSYVHRIEDGVFIFEPGEGIKRFGIGLAQPAYRLGVKAEGETEQLISLHDLSEAHKWSVNLNPESGDNTGLNIAQETADGSISRLFVQDGSGNVGVGTLYPEQKLHVENSSPASLTGIKLLNTATVRNNGWVVGHVNDNETERDGGLSFQSQVDEPAERMLITASGNVGINEADPATKLHVSMSDSDPNAVIALDESTGIVNIGPITDNIVMDFRGIQSRKGEFIGDVLGMETAPLNLQRLGGELLIHGEPELDDSKKIIVTDDGSIGVGTITPSEKIDVDGAIRIGNTESRNEGTIRWTGKSFEGYDGVEWISLAGSGGGSPLKGPSYIFVSGSGTPLANGAELTEALAKANELSDHFNLRDLKLSDIQPDWFMAFGEKDEIYYGDIVSVSSYEFILRGDMSNIPAPMVLQKCEVGIDKRTRYDLVFQGNNPVISNVVYDRDQNYTIFTLSTPFQEPLRYYAKSTEVRKIELIVAPGQYLLTKPLVLSNNFVNLISLTGNPDVELDLTDDHFYTGKVDLTSFGGEIIEVKNDPFVIINIEEQQINLNFVLRIEASCLVKGMKTRTHSSPTLLEFIRLQSEMFADAYWNWISIYPLPIDVKATDEIKYVFPTVENCRGGHYSFGVNLFDKYKAISGTFINNWALLASFGYRCEIWGTYENNSGAYSFAYNGVAGGRFVNHNVGDACFGGGADGRTVGEFIDCRAGDNSFGRYAEGEYTGCTARENSFGRETASGIFTKCVSGDYSFGIGKASGVFTGCIAGSYSFGTELATGIFKECTAGDRSFGNIVEGGVFTDCYAGDESFGKDGTKGIFTRCTAGNNSFGVGSASGTFTDCTAGSSSFGARVAEGEFTRCTAQKGSFGAAEVLNARLYYCRLTEGLFPTVGVAGRTVYCIDGNNEHNNQ